MNVRLHIERLVLDGFAVTPSQRTKLVDAVEAELSRLILVGSVSSSAAAGFSVPAVNGGAVAAGSPFNPVSFGHEVARAVYSSIGEPNE